MIRVDTMQDFERERAAMRPVMVHSRTRGEVLVPCANTLLVKTELVVANAYNPNTVAGDKMDLLCRSIVDNGFCFPIVTIYDAEAGKFVIVDGFHRSTVGGPDWLDLDYLPVVVLDHDMTQRMAATVQFNKARGVHAVDLDAELIRSLIEQGLSEEDVSARLGIDLEAVHRYKQITGVAALFKNAEYSMAWEIEESTE